MILAAATILGGLLNLPFVLKAWRSALEPALGGHDAPGLVIELIALRHPDRFGFVIAYAWHIANEYVAAGSKQLIASLRCRTRVCRHLLRAHRPAAAACASLARLATAVDQKLIDGTVDGIAGLSA